MMKGKGLKRGSRKKQIITQNGGGSSSNNSREIREERPPPPAVAPLPVVEQPPPEQMVHSHHRRKPSPEESALTSKNYRLAKELSELRVRHREECKSVSRLTMENMNLASRCREAISHVAMLKQELAMHQRRAAEALAFQRQQTQRMASNLSSEMSRLSASYSEDGEEGQSTVEIDKVLSKMPPPPPPPKNTAKLDPPQSDSHLGSGQKPAEGRLSPRSPDGEHSPTGELFSDLEEEGSVADSFAKIMDSSSPLADVANSQKLDGPPKVFSTPNTNRSNDRWSPKIGSPQLSSMGDKPVLFPGSASPKVDRSSNYNEEFPGDVVPQRHRSSEKPRLKVDPDGVGSSSIREVNSESPSSSVLQSRGCIGMNSIDAFEASFNTSFPAAFSARDKDANRKMGAQTGSSEIYNPFFPSPARPTEKSLDPIPINAVLSSPRSVPRMSAISSSPEATRVAHDSDAGIVSGPQTPDAKKNAGNKHPWDADMKFHTPPREIRSPEDTPQSEPSRPHKTVPPAARARYEKALQPRNGSSKQNPTGVDGPAVSSESRRETKSEKVNSILRGTPSALLKRIHQRRMNKQLSRQQSAPESSSHTGKETQQHPPVISKQRSAPDSMASIEKSGETGGPSASLIDQNGVMGSNAATPSESSHSDRQLQPHQNITSERPFDEPFDEIDYNRFGERSRMDAMARGAESANAENPQDTKSRRSVKQPLSYAEPALNTKLRQGDAYFQKPEERPQIVTPEQLSQA